MNPLCGDCEREGVWDGNVCVCPKCGLELATRPTATVHGTGSGEAKDWFESMPSLSDVPTPPASPTVTVHVANMERLANDTSGFVTSDVKDVANALLALLRAAERQK